MPNSIASAASTTSSVPAVAASRGDSTITKLAELQAWFAEHVTLAGQPYTLDPDQIRAVADLHRNTLVTARAGSGKTRVIVAKIAYLLARQGYRPEELAAFMFNRTAAAEVNQRLLTVQVDGQPILRGECRIASTFHKFALDLTKLAGLEVQIVTEIAQAALIDQALSEYCHTQTLSLSRQAYQENLQLVSSFIMRAGQKYPGLDHLAELEQAIQTYCRQWEASCQQPDCTSSLNTELRRRQQLHQTALAVYRRYLEALRSPRTDFNLLMATATNLLYQIAAGQPSPISPSHLSALRQRVASLRYLLIDEYQDFSYLFFSLVQGLRAVCPAARLFAVGDDWQAINRFAGSDCDYFLRFAEFFPDDTAEIPLATNYRSCRRIVANANRYMLAHYNPAAIPAQAFHRQKGKIYHLNPNKIRFDRSDLFEDQLGDAQFVQALAHAALPIQKVPTAAAQLLKTLVKIVKKHRRASIMFLHRHNFTSFRGISLEQLAVALQRVVVAQAIIDPAAYARQVRFLTMHRSKGLEANVVVLLEMNRELIAGHHPHADYFPIFGDNATNERADQQRLLYVALTRAKERLYILSSDQKPLL